MAQQNNPTPSPHSKKFSVKWIAVIVVIVVVVAAVIAVASMPHKQPTQTTPLSVSPIATGIYTQAGTNLTFDPGLPANAVFTKVVWNFGDGQTKTETSGNGVVSYAYSNPGSYLVSVTAFNSTSSISSNSSLLLITVEPSLSSNPAVVDGPMVLSGSSTGNQTIGTGGWINLTYAGQLAPTPLSVGSQVPGALNYTIQSFDWNLDSGASTINDNNTGLPETVNLTFSSTGLHVVDLVTTTTSGSSNEIGHYVMTIAVGNYTIMKQIPKTTVNTQQVVDAEFTPGGFRTLDPAIAYDSVSEEVMYEIYDPLVYYRGTSTTVFDPVLATNVPSVANGEVVTNQNTGTTNYTFYINTSKQFSNGDHVTPYDVYVSYARVLLFSNDPGTPGWIVAHALIPGPTVYGVFNTSFYWIHHAITWNNSSDSVTFHLLPATPTWLSNDTAVYAGNSYGALNQSYAVQNFGSTTGFLQLIISAELGLILDYNVLEQYGAAPANNSASYDYWSNGTTSPGLPANWNQELHYGGIGTGPYEISMSSPTTEVVLTVNPYYAPTQDRLPKSSLIPKVIIEYLTNEGEAQDQLKSGYAQLEENAFPPDATPLALNLLKQGIVTSVTTTQMAMWAFAFNMEINATGAKTYNSQTNIPSDFFANLNVRKAFSYAFNYTYWIDVANSNSGITFMENLTGYIPRGVPQYTSNLSSQYPEEYNLSLAKYYWSLTPYASSGQKYYFSMFGIQGMTMIDEMLSVMENDLSTISNGQLVVTTVDVSMTQSEDLSWVNPGECPMPIYWDAWYVDFPDATDFLVGFTGPGLAGYLVPDGGYPTNPSFNASQSNAISEMWNLESLATQTANVTKADYLYYQAQVIALNLSLFFGNCQPTEVLYYNPAINTNSLAFTLNPVVGGLFVIFYQLQYNS